MNTNTQDHVARSHRECSPSQLKRIMNCPGSRALKRLVAEERRRKKMEETSSTFALEGTMLHEVTECRIKIKYPQYFSKDCPPHRMEGKLTREQNTAVEECVDYFDSVLREALLEGPVTVELEAETKMDYAGIPEVGGHGDVKIQTPVTTHIIDWKFGQGIAVFVENNPQLMAYGAGSFESMEALRAMPRVVLHVGQPRLNYFQDWDLSGEDLADWVITELKPAILLSREKDAPCVPGTEQCQWCEKSRCQKFLDYAQEVTSEIFAAYAVKPPEQSIISSLESTERAAKLLEGAKMIDKFIKEVSGIALAQCLSGEGFPGYKAVVGRASRKWKDEKVAESFLVALADSDRYDIELTDIFETKMVSAPKAEKLHKDIKKSKKFQQLWVKLEGKPTLAPMSDKREAITLTAEDAFKSCITQEDAKEIGQRVAEGKPVDPALLNCMVEPEIDIFS